MNDHDRDDPMSYLHAMEAVGVAVTMPPCPHCRSSTRPLPMSGNGYGVEIFHEDGCPEHEDNQPTPERPQPDDDPEDRASVPR